MEEIKLQVELREKVGGGNVKRVRNDGFIPAVVYGGKQKDATHVKVNKRDYEKIMRQHKGQNVLFHLDVIDGGKKMKDYSAIIKEEQYEPVKDHVVHIDFQRISLEDEIEVKIHLESTGEAIGVKAQGGSLDHVLWELDVVCLPKNVPEKIRIDVSQLSIGDAIYVKDIKLPEGVKTKHDPDAICFTVVPPMKDAAAIAAEEKVELEVLKEKKPEEGKEAPAAEAAGDKNKEKEKK